MNKKSIAALFLIAFISGCVNQATARFSESRKLVEEDIFYVERLPADERGVNQLIADNLNQRNLRATTGYKSEIPENTTVLVSYIDKWMWDITMYMLELTVTFRDPDTGSTFASGHSLHTSLTRLSSEEMVDEVLSNIMAASAPASENAQSGQ